MSLKKEEIKNIAELSRLALSEAEEEKIGEQLSSILDYVDMLKDLDISGVSPTSFLGGLNNVWRKDEVKEWDREELKEALNLGDLDGDLIKVKRVL